jgi:hypothetical protein
MVNLQIKGYTPPSSLGYGTWTDITPSGGIIQVTTERNIDSGDSASITLQADIDFSEFESQRAIQIFLGGTSEPTNLIWEGIMLAPDIGVHSPFVNNQTYEIQCVGYEKFLMRKEITADWSSQSFDTIFGALATEANADMRFPTYKRFKYDNTKLTNYNSTAYTSTITKSVERSKIYDVFSELVPVLSGIDVTYAYEYGFYLDYHQSTQFIYVMPDMLDTTATATADFTDEEDIYANSLTFKRNFDKVINYSHAIGDGYETDHYNATALSATDVSVTSNNFDFAASGVPTQRSYLAIEITNDGTGNEFGSFSIDGYDAPVPANALSEDIYFYCPFNETITIYSTERYGDFDGATPFNIQNLDGATVNVYQCDYGIAGKSINDYGISQSSPRKLDLDTQSRVDNYAQQEVRLYHKPPTEVTFRATDFDSVNYLNKTVLLTDPFTDTDVKFLVTKQRYVIPENYDVEQWFTGIHTNYDWE